MQQWARLRIHRVRLITFPLRTASFLHKDAPAPPGLETRLQSGRTGSGNGADDCTKDFQTLLDPPRKRTHLKGEHPGPGWAACPAQLQIQSCSPPLLTHHRKTPNRKSHSVKQDDPSAGPSGEELPLQGPDTQLGSHCWTP